MFIVKRNRRIVCSNVFISDVYIYIFFLIVWRCPMAVYDENAKRSLDSWKNGFISLRGAFAQGLCKYVFVLLIYNDLGIAVGERDSADNTRVRASATVSDGQTTVGDTRTFGDGRNTEALFFIRSRRAPRSRPVTKSRIRQDFLRVPRVGAVVAIKGIIRRLHFSILKSYLILNLGLRRPPLYGRDNDDRTIFFFFFFT